MREGITEKPAQALRKGDVLFPTNRVIERVERGLRTPAGKVEVTYRNLNGDLRVAVWGANTKIGVIA